MPDKPRRQRPSPDGLPEDATSWPEAEQKAWKLLGASERLPAGESLNQAVWTRLGRGKAKPRLSRHVLTLSLLAAAAAILLIVRMVFWVPAQRQDSQHRGGGGTKVVTINAADMPVVQHLEMLENLNWLEHADAIQDGKDLEWLSVLVDLSREDS